MKKFLGAVVPDIVFIICDSFRKCKSLYEKLIIPRENVTILKQILDKPHPERDGFWAKQPVFRPKSGHNAERGGRKAERWEFSPSDPQTVVWMPAGLPGQKIFSLPVNVPLFPQKSTFSLV